MRRPDLLTYHPANAHNQQPRPTTRARRGLLTGATVAH
jgi:hypothetical protein